MTTVPAVESVMAGPPLDALTPAPTVGEIVADADRMERCATAIMHVFAPIEAPLEVRAVSEAAVLTDLIEFVAESDNQVRPEDREFLAQLPQMTFVDAEAMTQGAGAIARHWAELLTTLPNLNVVVAGGKSAIVVFDRVMDTLERESPDLLPRILPIRRASRELPPPSDELVARLRTGHTVLVDDWARMGEQMDIFMALFRTVGVPAANLEINLVSAPRSLLGMGVGGVACRSAFFMPEPVLTRPGNRGTNTPSMAGSHSIDDGGLGWRINDIFQHVPGVRRPLIAELVRAYGSNVSYIRENQAYAPASYWEQVDRLEQRSAAIAEEMSLI